MAILKPILRGVAALLIAVALADTAAAQRLAEDNWLTRMLQPSAAPSVPAPAPPAPPPARANGAGNPAHRAIR